MHKQEFTKRNVFVEVQSVWIYSRRCFSAALLYIKSKQSCVVWNELTSTNGHAHIQTKLRNSKINQTEFNIKGTLVNAKVAYFTVNLSINRESINNFRQSVIANIICKPRLVVGLVGRVYDANKNLRYVKFEVIVYDTKGIGEKLDGKCERDNTPCLVV